MKALLLCAHLLAASVAQAQAPAPTITGRLSAVVGSFTVGYATVGDGGSFNETLRTPDAAFSRNEADSGSASGMVGAVPVQGNASFAVAQDYAFTPALISASGSGATSADTPYAHVSVGARTISQLRLSFNVPVPTPFVLTGEVQHAIGTPVQGLAPAALATARLQSSTGGGGLWRSDSSPGAFTSSGTFMLGFTYTLEGLANSNLNANASFRMNLVLSPVPEPAAWALLSAGLGLLLWRRRVAAPALRT